MMNQRILELAKQSGLIQYDTDSKMNDVEKFAELIAADIAEMCATIDGGENMFSRAIREEYGVK
jgi:hypothetical protein